MNILKANSSNYHLNLFIAIFLNITVTIYPVFIWEPTNEIAAYVIVYAFFICATIMAFRKARAKAKKQQMKSYVAIDILLMCVYLTFYHIAAV